jgi:hypothetical protein
MSINTLSPAGSADVGQLVQRLIKAADTNKDGNLSTGEFGSFLTNLLDGAAARGGDLKGTLLATASSNGSAAGAALTPTTAPAGWDQTKWTNPTHHTTKYDVGRVLAKYPATTTGLQEAWLELSTLYPGASFNGKDTISGLPDTKGPVDVLVGASHGGDSWAWQDTGAK